MWALKPNFNSNAPDENWGFSSDGSGFRINPYETFAPSPRTFKIALVGDSFTYGHGVKGNETLAVYLQEMLQRKNYDVQVLNAGVCGYSPGQEYIYIQDVVWPRRPDLIIWNLDYADWMEMQMRSLHLAIGNSLVREPAVLNGFFIQGLLHRTFGEKIAMTRPLNFIIIKLLDFDAGRLMERGSDEKVFWKVQAMIQNVRAETGGRLLVTQTPSYWLLKGIEAFPWINNSAVENAFGKLGRSIPYYMATNDVLRRKFAASRGASPQLEDFFLDVKVDEFKHLNPAGNQLYAQIIYEYLDSRGFTRQFHKMTARGQQITSKR